MKVFAPLLGVARSVFFLWLFAAPLLPRQALAQTPQPVLFANSSVNSLYSTTTFLRDDVGGALTFLATSAPFAHPCAPQAIDAKGRFLFGLCAGGLSLYTFDSASGSVAEVAASPYSASSGGSGVLAVAESSGQFVYLLKFNPSNIPSNENLTLDTFQIDATTPALLPISTQIVPVAGSLVAAVTDPNQHGLAIFLNQSNQFSVLSAILYSITFDPATGAASFDPTGGINIGNNAQSLAINATGKYLAAGYGQYSGEMSVFQIGFGVFTLTSLGSYNLGTIVNQPFPSVLFFNPDGGILYVRAPAQDGSDTGNPTALLVFDSATFLQLPSSPLPLSDVFLGGLLEDSQGPFGYVANSANGAAGISVYLIDPGTGIPSQPSAIASPFAPQLALSPVLAPYGPGGGQNASGPALTPSASTITFPSTVVAQQSGPQILTLTSTGANSVSFVSIAISGANASAFTETDNCISAVLLKPNASCTVSLVYSPSTVGSTQASLVITDNAPGSPQQIPLLGTAVAAPPAAPVVTLNPPTALTFPGNVPLNTPSLPQSVSISNSGNAPLQISNVSMGGSNAADFSISSNTCASPVAPAASCSVSVVFTPLASGLRTTTLSFTDNAANSPQSLAVTGNSGSSSSSPGTPTITGSTTATVSAGQTAQFNLIASASGNFTGSLSFTCTGAPFVATCSAPTSVTMTAGAPVSFTVSVSTTAASGAAVLPPPTQSPRHFWPRPLSAISLFLCAFLFFETVRRLRITRIPNFSSALTSIFFAALLASGIACGGGGGGSVPQSTAPAGTTQAATPAMQPAGGTFSTSYPTVAISDTTPGSTIYFTTDGSTPTSNSAIYSTPFTVNTPVTIQAMASAPSYSASAVATSSFTFQTPTGTTTISLTPTVTPSGTSSKPQTLSPIPLTLTVK